ncbi:DUF3370 domain-containing protein [Rivularia sp. UHCC 0363]|uniref:DUF3370 domain-containing protein n=1 Tax=Rivularia sp. UHCC 0363 TaxID=3110244 RepID=UPI002B203C2E|nr:DUF3370 domain-containing protein [Rivularia sp. UHCC 0363]MEA5593525.1 DUF3370 domain-containing protein [Rivularia sp. UHCC 0363]
MFSFLLNFPIAQTIPPTPAPVEVVQPQQVRPLPGELDDVPVFNSNSPELVLKEGILLSTFPARGKKVSSAHLNFAFKGRFDIFAHHVAKASAPDDLKTLYLGIILHNPSKQTVTVDVLHAASYLSQPDAPFIDLPSQVSNNLGTVFAGPGSRVMSNILRNQRQSTFPAQLIIPPGESRILLNAPIPVKELDPPINGRSTLIRLRSSGKVYAASLAMFAPTNIDGSEREPTLQEWQNLLDRGDLAGPRDKAPTPPKDTEKPIIYGRVSGVAKGSQWNSLVVDRPKKTYLTIPASGQAFSYGIATLHRGALGTNQIQTAKMLVRYPDTAYYAHGNYGILYSLQLPLLNKSQQPQTVKVSLQTPIKEDKLSKNGLRFFDNPEKRVFFRGTVRVRYTDDRDVPRTTYWHLVQNRGDKGEALVMLNIKPGSKRLVEVDLLYPPDATPPQVLTVETVR